MGKIEPFNDAEIAEWLERAKRAGVGAFENILRFKARYDAAEAERDRLDAECEQLADQCDDLEIKLEDLQAVVDKLPKTADGVPVVPGMKVWRNAPLGVGEHDTLYYDDYNGMCVVLDCRDSLLLEGVSAMYSTREAALAASSHSVTEAEGE